MGVMGMGTCVVVDVSLIVGLGVAMYSWFNLYGVIC